MITEQLFPLQFDEFFVGHMLSGSDFMESRAPFSAFSQLLLLEIFVQKVFETNLNFR
jgi:hypothetical protein